VRDAVVEQQGVSYMRPDGQVGTMYGGSMGWIDPLAVTDEKGDFEIAYSKPAVSMILQVRARGMATRLFTQPTGAERRTMTVTEGATVRGRLVHEGKPVANAELGLTTHSRNAANYIAEVRIGTREDGEMVDIGDLTLKQAYTLRGKVALSDGKTIPPGMRITLSADLDTQVAPLAADGSFAFRGLAADVYQLTPAVKGYQIPEGIKEVLANRDIDGLVITLQPAASRR
jgi:hypothetical protein